MRKLMLALLLAGSLLVGAGGSALAANERASCVGLILSDHARWGDLPGLVQDAKALAKGLGLPFGQFVSSTARLHLRSHAVCGNE